MIPLFGSVAQGIHRQSFHRSTHLAMYTLFSLCISFLFIVSINATALMTQISANEKLCFYTEVDKAGEKIGVCNLSVSRFIITDWSCSSILLCVI